MNKSVILTGLRANNDLHLGNYLGALLPMVQLQNKYAGKYQINLFVPDLHSFTTPIDHTKLYEQTMNNLKIFVACGLDLNNPDTYIYRQSYIPAHSELTVILNCFTYMGELSRMTQFKEKGYSFSEIITNLKYMSDAILQIDRLISSYSDKDRFYEQIKKSENVINNLKKLLVLIHEQNDKREHSNVSAGLFDYPVLMASDILLYGAKYVPVGADQTQHVELARDVAIRMNNKFGKLFTPPEPEKDQIQFAHQQERLRVRDLADPTKKMSKSDDTGKGVIFLNDDPVVAVKKIMSATTDSFAKINYDYDNQPGISNLIDILASLSGREVSEVTKEYRDQDTYGPLKTATSNAVKEFLIDFKQKLSCVDESKLIEKLEQSEEAMNKVANTTLARVQTAVGLRAV